MTPRRITSWAVDLLLVAGVIALAIAAWRQVREAGASQAKIANAQAQLETLQARTAAARAGATEAIGRRASGLPAAQGRQDPGTLADPMMVEDQRIIREYARQRDRISALNGFLPGFAALRLPPAAVARAKEIVLAASDQFARLRQNRPSSPGWEQAFARIHRDEEDQLTALLGEPAYQQVQAYAREDHLDWTVGTDMWDGGEPLNSDQLHALALTEVQAGFQEASMRLPGTPDVAADPATGLRPQDVALLAASARFLSAGQLAILRQNLIDDNRYQAAMRGFAAKQAARNDGRE